MILRSGLLTCMLLGVAVLQADGFAGVCGDVTGVTRFRETGVDAAGLPANCFVIPEAQTTAQVTIWQSTPDKRHLQVISGLLALKPQAEIDAITAADAALAATQAEIQNELTTNPACNATSLQDALDKIQTQKEVIQADIDAATNIATAKTAMTTANNRLTAIDTNIVKCIFAILRGKL